MTDIAQSSDSSHVSRPLARQGNRAASPLVRVVRAHGAATALIALWLWSAIAAIGSSAVNSFETGVYVNGGARLLQGQHVYKDFFSIYGPLTYYPFALTQLFSSNPHVSSQIVFIAFSLLDAILTYCVVRGITTNRWLQLLAIVASLTYSGGGFRLPLALAAVLCVMRYANSGRPWTLAAAGGLAAANLAIQQDMAAFTLAAVGFSSMVIAMARSPRGAATWQANSFSIAAGGGFVVAGFAAIAAIFMGWMASLGTARLYVHDAFVVTLSRYDTLHMRTIPAIWAAPPLAPGVVSMWARLGIDGLMRWFFYTLPFFWVPGVCACVAIAATIVLWRRRVSASDLSWWSAMLVIAVLGLCMSRSILKTGDEIKLKVNSLPAALLVIGMADRLWRRRSINSHGSHPARRPSPSLARCGIILAVMLLIFETYPLLQGQIKGRLHPALSPYSSASGVSALDIQRCGSVDVARISAYLKTHATDGRLFCVPSVPILYVDTGLRNVTSYDYLDPIIAPEVCGSLVRQLNANPPQYVVVVDGLRFWDQYEFGQQFGQDVAAYIAAHYATVYHCGDYRVMRLKSQKAA